MRVDGVGSNSAIAAKMNKKPHPVKEGKSIEVEQTQVVERPEPGEKTKGVIRLLQAGHFKGVADVRLRINFHEELQALENQNLKTTAASGFENINQTIQDQVAALKDSGLLNDEQTAALDVFWKDLQNGQSEFLNGENSSLQKLFDDLKAKLDSLMGSLTAPAPVPEQQTEPLAQEVVGPDEQTAPPEPQAATPEVPAEAGGEQPVVEAAPPEPAEVLQTEPLPQEPSPLQQIVQRFQESIQQALDRLQSDLNGSSVLPPISEPSGNGKAYAKFLAIYESMQAGAAPDLPEPELLDLEEVIVPEAPEPDSELEPQPNA